MKVITRYPIIAYGKMLNKSKIDKEYIFTGADGSSMSPADTLRFQNWVKYNFDSTIKVDGIWGPQTQTAYDNFGTQYNASAGKNPVQDKPVLPKASGPKETTSNKNEVKAAGDSVQDTIFGMPKWIAYSVGGLLAFGAMVIVAVKLNKK